MTERIAPGPEPNPTYLSPSAIGEYISQSQCPRYAKHVFQEIDQSVYYSGGDFTEAFNPLNILLSTAGDEFETRIYDNCEKQTCRTIDCEESDGETFYRNHSELVNVIKDALDASEEWGDAPVMLYQPGLSGTISLWDVQGDADMIFIWSTSSGVEVRIIDVKRASDEKVYHQIQVATYIDLLASVIEESDISASVKFAGGERDQAVTDSEASKPPTQNDLGDETTVELSGGVITWESTYLPLSIDVVPAFEVEPRIMDIRRLLEEEGPITEAIQTPLEKAPHQLNQKCSTCPYNEGCVTDAFEDGHPRLLGLSIAKQQQLVDSPDTPIETLEDLASLGITPSADEWKPTTYESLKLRTSEHQKLEATVGVGEALTQLVYQSEGILDTFDSDSGGISDRPRHWLPGSGRCNLPDDDPPEDTDFDQPYAPGSMVRVYLNIQYDQLRDRVIQASARVSATESECDAQRLSVVSSGASDNIEVATNQEQELLDDFAGRICEAIRTVADGLELDEEPHGDPPLHFYTYTERELDVLTEAFDRHTESESINALRSAIEGTERPDERMVSPLLPEVDEHIILETPSPGLIHAHEELSPPTEAYSKSHRTEEWEYSPPDSEKTYDLRQMFGRRLFDIGVDCTRKADSISVDPETSNPVDGVNTRMRYDASIPLGYLWASIGRINDEWADRVDDSALAEFELDNYRYRNRNRSQEEIQPADIRALGRNLCDVIEHVERALIYKDSRFTKAPYPLDTLPEDTFSPPSLATGAQRYLLEEYRADREEKYDVYRRFARQRILSGDSIPVEVEELEQVTYNTLRVTATLNYRGTFEDNAAQIRSACRKKGSDGTSGGSWMVANEFYPSTPQEELTVPWKIESGVNATIESLKPQTRYIEFTLRNFWGDSGDFGSVHRNWTQDSSKRNDDDYLYIEEGDTLILDPQTDDITSDRIQRALENAETNELHDRLEAVRRGETHTPTTSLFQAPDDNDITSGQSDLIAGVSWIDSASNVESDPMAAFADWLKREVGEDTYPSEEQQEFITAGDAQFLCLQGPPGTGKTAATMAPSLLARACAAATNGRSLNFLVTAPSNTAIDQLLEDTAELLETAKGDGGPFASGVDIELFRIAPTVGKLADKVTAADYNNEDHDGRIRRLDERLRTHGSLHEDDAQQSLTDYSGDGEPQKDNDATEDNDDTPPITFVFATVARTWRLLKEIAPSSKPEDSEIAAQSLWDVIAVDEASMFELPDLLLAGSAFRGHGQVLVAGDHRQLPPVQKRDWEDTRRRDLRATAAHLSTLDYLRLLRGEDVLEDDQLAGFECNCTRKNVQIPLVQLVTTYRFDDRVASLMQRTVYSKDGIPYESGRESDIVDACQDPPDPLATIFGEDTSVALIAYNPTEYHQQWNPIESIITQTILYYTTSDTDIGIVTPHNAHRGHLQSTLSSGQNDSQDSFGRGISQRDVQIDTVNRFQGGERDLMVLNATVSDPSYIDSESEFLLQENRINVSLTRHRDLLVVVVPESILGYVPGEPELYEQATIWKVLASDLGESPTATEAKPNWQGELGNFLVDAGWTPETVPDFLNPMLPSEIFVYTLGTGGN